MTACFVVQHPRDWPYDTPGATVVAARDYLDDAGAANRSGSVPSEQHGPQQVVNLCKSYRYQSRGYYVSLLAEARGHRPLPDVKTIEDLNQSRLLRLLTARLDDTIRQALAPLEGHELELDVCFGVDPCETHALLARQLFECLRLPLLKARFERDCGADDTPGRRGWRLVSVRALGPTDIAQPHRPAMARAAAEWLRGAGAVQEYARGDASRRPAIAILHDANSADTPSNPQAMRKFCEAAESVGMHCEILSHRDIERLGEFDALFIRDTTSVNHYTYRFSRRAAAQGLVVIDDPDSILRCTNKVYLHELLTRHAISTPQTLMVHKGNRDRVAPTLGLPCILKQPDSAFSLGVKKVHTEQELEATVAEFLRKSELIVAQEFLPTAFDWRIGVLDGKLLFACKYFMAPGHWQVIKRDRRTRSGRIEGMTVALPIEEVPVHVTDTAVRAAALIGDGLYGVDLKQVDERCYVIEINDNPNVDAGNEDGVLQDALYREVMDVFLRRVRARRTRSTT